MSIRSRRFVAAMTSTPSLESMPSSSVRSWLTTDASPELPGPTRPRSIPRESNSSKKTTQGAIFLALSRRVLTALSDSPCHIERSSGPLTLRNCAPATLATARARAVFPVPGGPCMSTPEPILSPAASYNSG